VRRGAEAAALSSKFFWFDLPAQGCFHAVMQMSAVDALRGGAAARAAREGLRSVGRRGAWRACRAVALSLALRGCVPSNQGLSLAGVPPPNFSPLRMAMLRAAPCFLQAAALRAYNVPLQRWTAPVTVKEYADFLALAGASAAATLGSSTRASGAGGAVAQLFARSEDVCPDLVTPVTARKSGCVASPPCLP
jgi:hypothetical protein